MTRVPAAAEKNTRNAVALKNKLYNLILLSLVSVIFGRGQGFLHSAEIAVKIQPDTLAAGRDEMLSVLFENSESVAGFQFDIANNSVIQSFSEEYEYLPENWLVKGRIKADSNFMVLGVDLDYESSSGLTEFAQPVLVSDTTATGFYTFRLTDILFSGCNGDSLGVSTESSQVYIHQPPTDFELSYPTDSLVITTFEDSNTVSYIFQWNSSVDPDGNTIDYQVVFETENDTIVLASADNGADTSLSLTTDYLKETVFQNESLSLVKWYVIASDQLAETKSEAYTLFFQPDNKINDIAAVPRGIHLMQNYPNPFNPSTKISILVSEPTFAELMIYNLLGQEVIVLHAGKFQTGQHIIEWNGKNAFGQTVESGIYFYTLKTPRNSVTRKMLLLR